MLSSRGKLLPSDAVLWTEQASGHEGALALILVTCEVGAAAGGIPCVGSEVLVTFQMPSFIAFLLRDPATSLPLGSLFYMSAWCLSSVCPPASHEILCLTQDHKSFFPELCTCKFYI